MFTLNLALVFPGCAQPVHTQLSRKSLSSCERLTIKALLSPHISHNSESAASKIKLISLSLFYRLRRRCFVGEIVHVTGLFGHVIERRISRRRQLFLASNPKQTNMADREESRSLLGAEDEASFSGTQTSGGPGRPMPAICDPSHLLHRVVVLVFMCFLGFGELENGKFPEHPQ